ncbi:MAG: 4Fe-4S dicluster domain-containing protein [Endomicrobia bacterium]|nr:4Fe-4S dicluster domain-containing protein [Endomicrobiia bacterium]
MYLYIDTDKCRGCKTCEIICSFRWSRSFSPTYSAIYILKNEKVAKNIPIVCQQCSKPLCVEVCLSSALKRDEKLGVVLHNKNQCVGCKMCVISCPFAGIGYVAEIGVTIKCDLCQSYDKEPGVAQCEKMCPYKAIKVIKEEKIIVELRKDIEKFLSRFGIYKNLIK